MKAVNVKQCLTNRQGMTLAELMIGIALAALLLAVVGRFLFLALTAWQSGNSSTTLQQTARFAADSIVRDVQYARSINLHGTDQVSLTTDKYGMSNQLITYSYDTAVKPPVLRRNKNDGSGAQPMTGGNSNAMIGVSACRFTVLATSRTGRPRTVNIAITVLDGSSGRQFTVETAVTGRMVPP